MPQVSVIIPVFNSMATLKACMESVLAARNHFGDAEVILIDHGSMDGSYEFLCTNYGMVAKIYQRKGGTIASLRNHAARQAEGEYFCFVDSDCVLCKRHLENAMEVFARLGPDATGCKYDLPPLPHWVEETWAGLHQRTQDGYVNYLNAGNFVIKGEVFKQVGGFDERLPTDEDADLGGRMLATGFKIFEAHNVSAIHLGNPKTLLAFFKKELWHGSGMFRMHGRPYVDKVFLATIFHFCLVILGMILAIALKISLLWRIIVLLLGLLFVPSVTLSFRFVKSRKVFRPVRALLLYFVFFSSKGAAMIGELTRAFRAALARER